MKEVATPMNRKIDNPRPRQKNPNLHSYRPIGIPKPKLDILNINDAFVIMSQIMHGDFREISAHTGIKYEQEPVYEEQKDNEHSAIDLEINS